MLTKRLYSSITNQSSCGSVSGCEWPATSTTYARKHRVVVAAVYGTNMRTVYNICTAHVYNNNNNFHICLHR